MSELRSLIRVRATHSRQLLQEEWCCVKVRSVAMDEIEVLIYVSRDNELDLDDLNDKANSDLLLSTFCTLWMI